MIKKEAKTEWEKRYKPGPVPLWFSRRLKKVGLDIHSHSNFGSWWDHVGQLRNDEGDPKFISCPYQFGPESAEKLTAFCKLINATWWIIGWSPYSAKTLGIIIEPCMGEEEHHEKL